MESIRRHFLHTDLLRFYCSLQVCTRLRLSTNQSTRQPVHTHIASSALAPSFYLESPYSVLHHGRLLSRGLAVARQDSPVRRCMTKTACTHNYRVDFSPSQRPAAGMIQFVFSKSGIQFYRFQQKTMSISEVIVESTTRSSSAKHGQSGGRSRAMPRFD